MGLQCCIWYITPWPEKLYFQSIQPTRYAFASEFLSNPDLDNAMCFQVSCTHGIIISLCLICYIQCRFSIACLSIPGIAASDRCKISNSFTFSSQFQSPAVLFIYIAAFREDLKRIGEIGNGSGVRSYSFVPRLACLISVDICS